MQNLIAVCIPVNGRQPKIANWLNTCSYSHIAQIPFTISHVASSYCTKTGKVERDCLCDTNLLLSV